MDDIIKIVESLEKLGLLIDGARETTKHEIKNQEGKFLPTMIAPMAASLITPIVSSLIQLVTPCLINAIFGKGVRRAGQGQKGGFLPLLASYLMIQCDECCD